MKKALCVLAILAMAVTATATVRVFVTAAIDGYGLNEAENHSTPTFSSVDAIGNNLNAYDFYYSDLGPMAGTPGKSGFSVSNFPPIGAPSGTDLLPVEIGLGDYAYIWVQFQNEPKAAKINGLKVEITGGAGFATTYYVQNDLGGAVSKKRWDGTATPAAYPEWHNNPQTMVAITAGGLVNGNDDPQNMFDYQTGTTPRTGVALIGAIDFGPGAGGNYHIDIIDISYATPPNPVLAGGVFHYVPEPASLLLMSLAGLILRRR